MKHLFLDTNVVIDVLANRQPFCENSAKMFEKAKNGNVKLFISSLSYSTIYYILNKEIGHKSTIETLKKIDNLIETLDVTSTIVKKSLYSDFPDFEDAIQYFTAISNKKIKVIVTRNHKDFKKSELLVLSPDEVLSL
jgi:predicted nucleic acid-binding protein